MAFMDIYICASAGAPIRVVLAVFFNCSRVVGQVESPTGVGATYAMDAYVRSPGPAPLRLRSSGLLNLTSYICWVIWFNLLLASYLLTPQIS